MVGATALYPVSLWGRCVDMLPARGLDSGFPCSFGPYSAIRVLAPRGQEP